MMRANRRSRKTPYRQNKMNRTRKTIGWLAPSTRARWGWKLRIVTQLNKIFPISDFVVEDIKAKTLKGKGNRWNRSFSPLETGKNWFYYELRNFGNVHLKQGYETAKLRDKAGLIKSSAKLSNKFEAHCVDSWILANSLVEGKHSIPENKNILFISPIKVQRRQLHKFQFSKGGKRIHCGGTNNFGFKKGSLVVHKKHGLTYVGGSSKDRISLPLIIDGKRLSQGAKITDIRFKSYNVWKSCFLYF